jgi:hypothetical protein
MNILITIAVQVVFYSVVAGLFYHIGYKRGTDTFVDLWLKDKIFYRPNPEPISKIEEDENDD